MQYNNILFDVSQKVGTLTLNDPDRFNALNQDMLAEVAHVVESIRRNTDIRVLVVTGSGKAFSAGGDIRRMEKRFDEPPPMARNRIRNFQSLILSLRELQQPVIASINGPAVGAGCSLALACDLRIASQNAKFGLPYAKLGITTDGGGAHLLTRLVGTARALELLFSGEIIDADRAERIGLVNRVVPHQGLSQASGEWAHRLSGGPPYAMGVTKSIVYKSFDIDLGTELDLEAYAVPVCLQSEDHREGVKAFIDKREPKFYGK
jgi:2-(1,2-epoxy-1,2-dihydrophenyl)acetyl-CoA isomerase